MAKAKQLTERQQEIVNLLDHGKTPREVADALEITENAVYQHIRRIRDGGHKVTSNGNAQAGRSRPRAAAPPSAPPAKPPAEPRTMTPLQAIRARKDVIEQETKAADASVAAAEKALAHAREGAERVHAKHGAELAQLVAAEAALTGKPPAPKPKRSRAKPTNGSTPVQPQAAAPEPEREPEPAPSADDPGAHAVDAEFAE